MAMSSNFWNREEGTAAGIGKFMGMIADTDQISWPPEIYAAIIGQSIHKVNLPHIFKRAKD
jgi:hypothetical protein